jgi:two-component system sensor histidine kinase RpfC
MKILIIEDNKISRRNLVLMAQMCGHATDATDTAESAYELIAMNNYDAVVADLRLPGKGNGLDALERQRDKSPSSKRVLVTAFFSSDVRDAADRIGAVYIEKPITLSSVMDYIEGRPQCIVA